MTKEIKRWKRAGHIAYLAMSTETPRVGRGKRINHRVDDDPLAWWCLTELIYDLGSKP